MVGSHSKCSLAVPTWTGALVWYLVLEREATAGYADKGQLLASSG